MAKIEDLIAQIHDERLKKAIGAEVRELKKIKKFGLVFEEHLPETVRLPKMPVKVAELVAKKRESGNELWRVKSIRKGIATLEKAVEGYPLPSEMGVEVPVAELVVVRSFGDPIYPALVPVDRVARGGPDSPGTWSSMPTTSMPSSSSSMPTRARWTQSTSTRLTTPAHATGNTTTTTSIRTILGGIANGCP